MIRINNTTLDEDIILSEMQYHSGENQREAMIKASESLIIAELFKQRALALGIGDVSDENFVDELIAADVNIPKATQEDCRNYYDQNLDKFCTTPLLAVKHILLAADPEDEMGRIEATDKAKLLIRQLQQDESQFARLAEAHSRCPSAKTGGQLGQITRGQTVPEFERQLFCCEPGLVLKPMESRYGIHVVAIDHRVEGRQLTFEMAEERIADYLNEKVRRKAIAQYIDRLIAEADIEGFDFSVSESPLLQ
jgi:peptidyl-prolyl cis-trans isomerase C